MMRKLKLRREIVRNLTPNDMVDARGGQQVVTTAISCTALLQCLPSVKDCIVIQTLQGCTTAVDCP